MSDLFEHAVFYHIYPLGLCGAPLANDFSSAPERRLHRLYDWIPHIRELGCDALYLGPVFESDFHGYDTADYCLVDRRLGTNADLKKLSDKLQAAGIRLVLDTVFNHVGRNFFAFKDLQLHGDASPYKDWFCGVDFTRQSTYGDPFWYEGWYDAYNLVRLNLANFGVRDYLFSVVDFWLSEFEVDGLRLDVAEIMDKTFLAALAAHCRRRKPDIWLLGEMIEGDYTELACPGMLDSTTNYELYESLQRNHRLGDYHQLARTIDRQSSQEGQYRHLSLYTFADNHDTTRVASLLPDPKLLPLVYTLLLTLPGIPAIYYGSEWGLKGEKGLHDDYALRPEVPRLPMLADCELFQHIRNLIRIRQMHPLFGRGDIEMLVQDPLQIVYSRRQEDRFALIAVNKSAEVAALVVKATGMPFTVLSDQLQHGYRTYVTDDRLAIQIPAFSARILTNF